MSIQIVEMKQQRADIIGRMGGLNALAKKEGREFTDEEKERWEGMERLNSQTKCNTFSVRCCDGTTI